MAVMKDFDLDAKLKSVPLPERTEDYWENFPAQVRWNLRRAAMQPEAPESWRPQLAWKFGVSFACLVVGLLVLSQPLKAASCAIFQKEHFVRQQLAALPGELRVLMADEHGLHYLVAEKE
jgi:hypothetical protein